MVLNTFFKLIKFNLQITFPTFPIKIYLLLTPYVLLFPCACVYCQCQKWPSVFIAWRNAYNYHIFCANHCRDCFMSSQGVVMTMFHVWWWHDSGRQCYPPHQTGGMVHTIQNMVQWCPVSPHHTTTDCVVRGEIGIKNTRLPFTQYSYLLMPRKSFSSVLKIENI